MKTKIKLYFILLLSVLVSTFVIYRTYALFETNIDYETDIDIGKWVIKINDKLLSGEPEKIIINNFKYTTSTTVEDGFIAPGRNGYVDIILDPTGTEVAARVDITFDDDAIPNENITYDVTLTNGTSLTRTGENTYTKVIPVDELDSSNITLRVNIIWNNLEEYDETDSELGSVFDTKLTIPINIKVEQYLGETITEYQE